MVQIYETNYKNISGVCVETDKMKAVFLPRYGAKLASLVYKDENYELLAQDTNEIYLEQSPCSVYVENEVSAVDDLFPTIDPCKTGFANDAEYPCHGETLRFPHSYAVSNEELSMEFHSETFGYRFVKKVCGTENGGIAVSYSITNCTNEDFPCIFGLHCMLTAETGGRVLTFENSGNAVIMFDEDSQFGKPMETVPICDAMFISAPYHKQGNAYKFYLCDEKTTHQCGYYNPEIDKNIILSYDCEALPYLGVWMNNGTFKGMYNVALEPCTAPYDSPANAIKKGYNFVIASGETFHASVVYDVK